MSKVILILFLSTLSVLIYAQAIDNPLFEKLEQAIKDKEVDVAKSVLTKIENSSNLTVIERYRVLEGMVNVNRLEGNRSKEIELMTEYVLKPEFDALFETNKHLRSFRPRNDTTKVYLNKSTYTRKLANDHNLLNNHSKALAFLNVHEAKYLFPHPCGNGHAKDQVERTILFSEINQSLENNDSVIHKLLPFTFDYSMGSVGEREMYQKKIDSLLFISLKTKYTNEELVQEFERCINSIPPELKDSGIGYETEIELFNTTVKVYTVKMYQSKEERAVETYKIRDKVERESMKDEIYRKSYVNAIATNRIYKAIMI